MAAVAAPKSAGGEIEREKEGKGGKKEERRNERNRRERKKRERRGRGTDVLWAQNTPLELSKNYKRHGKGEAEKDGRRDKKKGQRKR